MTYKRPTTQALNSTGAAVLTVQPQRSPTTTPPSGAAGGDLTGFYPDPTIKANVNLTGAPTAATAAPGTNTTQIATTAFVLANSSSGGNVDGGQANTVYTPGMVVNGGNA